jgi:hypothetical protein
MSSTSSTPGAFAFPTAARSGLPASSLLSPTARKTAEPLISRRSSQARCHLARRGRCARSLRPPKRVCLPCRQRHAGAKPAAEGRRRAGLQRDRRKGLRQRLVDGRGHGTRRKKGHLGRVPRHKKRGKYRRYFDWDWAFYAGRGHGSHRTTSRGNDLPELRASLDTGLCCDYFEAQYAGDRICRHNAQVTGKPANSSSWLCRGPPRSTDRGGANRAGRSSEWELTRHDPEKWASAFGGKSCSGKAGARLRAPADVKSS